MGVLSTLLQHPDEVVPLLRVRQAAMQATRLPSDPDLAFCYGMLNRVSRSFAVVIQQLGPSLRDAICIFYLVLRALDTVEDDMAVPVDVKLPILKCFHDHICDPSWRFVCGTKYYKDLMENIHHVRTVLLRLDKGYREVILNITRRMGEGMAKFIQQEVETVAQYDEYCHYVAGLVGIGLSDLFVAARLEDPVDEAQSNDMGLFLQKTNIIRDYLEDINEEPAPRMFWPKEIWGKYASNLEDFKGMPGDAPKAVACLDELVVNALQHAPTCLRYLARLKDGPVFRFCAIPQVMAMGTLYLCYGNVQLFRGVVKMRRGQTAKIMDGTKSMVDVYAAFDYFAQATLTKVTDDDVHAQSAREILNQISHACEQGLVKKGASRPVLRLNHGGNSMLPFMLLLIVVLVLICFFNIARRLWG